MPNFTCHIAIKLKYKHSNSYLHPKTQSLNTDMLKLFHFLSILSLFLFTYKDELLKLCFCLTLNIFFFLNLELVQGSMCSQKPSILPDLGGRPEWSYSRNKPFTIWAKIMWVLKKEREALLLVLFEEKGKSQMTEHMRVQTNFVSILASLLRSYVSWNLTFFI